MSFVGRIVYGCSNLCYRAIHWWLDLCVSVMLFPFRATWAFIRPYLEANFAVPMRNLKQTIKDWNILGWLRFLIAVSFIFFASIGTAFVTYFFFYLWIVPSLSFETPIYFHFDGKQFPRAPVFVDENFFAKGHQYQIDVILELPESPTNIELGMFMVGVELVGTEGYEVATASKPLRLRYKSMLAQAMNLLFRAIPLMFGWFEETQTLELTLLEDLDDGFSRATFFLSKPNIEVYSARVRITTKLMGVGYYVYYWFFSSSVIGISLLISFQLCCAMCLGLCLQRVQEEEDFEGFSSSEEEEEEEGQQDEGRPLLEDEEEAEVDTRKPPSRVPQRRYPGMLVAVRRGNENGTEPQSEKERDEGEDEEEEEGEEKGAKLRNRKGKQQL